MATAIAVKDPELRSALRDFHARLETALSLAARYNWTVGENLEALDDSAEIEHLDLAAEIRQLLWQLIETAMADDRIDAAERQAIGELLETWQRLVATMRRHDKLENDHHAAALGASTETRRCLRTALKRVGGNLDTLNHKRGGVGQPIEFALEP